MNKGAQPLITIYTCVYNMADKINRAIDSVKAQSYKNIEHLIIDDGSTDGLKPIIEDYIKSVDYEVVYIFKENGGKHTAENVAFMKSRGDYLVQLDADDELLPEALSCFMQIWDNIKTRADYNNFWCVSCGVRSQLSNQLFGDPFPENINELDEIGRKRILSQIQGEKCGCMRRDVICSYRFPEPPYVKFVTESVVWNKVNSLWKTWYSNEIVRIYHIDEGASLSKPQKSPQYFANYNWQYRYTKINGKRFKICDYIKYALSYFMSTDEYRTCNRYLDEQMFSIYEKGLVVVLCFPSWLIAKALLLLND